MVIAVLSTLLVIALFAIAFLIHELHDQTGRAHILLDTISLISAEKEDLNRRLEKRIKRHHKAVGVSMRLQETICEKQKELDRSGRVVEMLLEMLTRFGIDDREVVFTRNEARRLFVA